MRVFWLTGGDEWRRRRELNASVEATRSARHAGVVQATAGTSRAEDMVFKTPSLLLL